MFFIILGAGEVGIRLAQILSKEKHEVVLIEKAQERVVHIYNKIDCKIIIDEGARSDILREAGILNTDYFIAASNSDEVNLISCMLVHQLAPHVKKIVRIRDSNYIVKHARDNMFPIDYVVHPEREAALSIIRSIEFGGGESDALTFQHFGDLLMRKHFIDRESAFIGTKLKDVVSDLEIPQNISNKFLVALINRKDEAIIPTGEIEFQEGDEVYFLGERGILEDLLLHLGRVVKKARKIKKIIILGATPLAEQLVECYSNTRKTNLSTLIGKRRFANREITVIDDDMEKCNNFVEKYPHITVLHADMTSEDVLEDLEIGKVDMLISTTIDQEKNIVLAAHSHNLGVPHTICMVRNPLYFNIAAELGISMSLSVRSEVVSSIINFLRGQRSLYSLVEGSYGLFERIIHPKSRVVFKAISKIVLPPKTLILCISNNDGNNITTGNTVLQAEDRLLCIAHPESVDRLDKLFAYQEESTDNDTESTKVK